MPIHRFLVDFNEMLAADLCLLSRGDRRMDVLGVEIELESDMIIEICEPDVDDSGSPDWLIGVGIVVPTPIDAPTWASSVKWCCQLNPPGVRHASQIGLLA